jgi:hypothetical protein
LLPYLKESNTIGLFKAKDSSNREILNHSQYGLAAEHFSPDGR